MKYALLLFVFAFVVMGISCQRISAEKLATEALAAPETLRPQLFDKALPTPNAGATKSVMQQAWYEYSTSQTLPPTAAKSKFTVVTQPTARATNFVSSSEQWLRQRSTTTVNTAYLYFTSLWKGMTRSQRRAAQQRAAYRRQADWLHAVNNQRQALIWLLNNSTEPVVLGTQDGSVFCILQALDKNHQWRPVQYWQFSKCGTSYSAHYLRPGETLSLLAKMPSHGDFKTKLRYKLASVRQFYYSNELEGRISYSEFAEPPGRYGRSATGQRVATFKLDSLPSAYFARNRVGNRAFPFHQGGEWGASLPY